MVIRVAPQAFILFLTQIIRNLFLFIPEAQRPPNAEDEMCRAQYEVRPE